MECAGLGGLFVFPWSLLLKQTVFLAIAVGHEVLCTDSRTPYERGRKLSCQWPYYVHKNVKCQVKCCSCIAQPLEENTCRIYLKPSKYVYHASNSTFTRHSQGERNVGLLCNPGLNFCSLLSHQACPISLIVANLAARLWRR